MADVLRIDPSGPILGDIVAPGDKSISHRAVILSALCDRETTINNLLFSDDVLSTINILRELGVIIHSDVKQKMATVEGVGLHGLTAPKKTLDCGNAGTAMRLLTGLLSAQKFNSVLMGDASLTKRPMLRVAEPLRLMGAKINLSKNNTAPIEIIGNQKLKAIDYALTIPSAQVKSAILLAGLYTHDKTTVKEKMRTRDHTERLLTFFHSHPHLKIPGDISSAAFFIVAAAITPGSDLVIRQVGINIFRTGIIAILKRMGANIRIFNKTFFGLEPVADVHIQYAALHGINIPRDLIINTIDEFPAIFIAAASASGNTILRGANELRVKESDRIATMANGLRVMGVHAEEYDDGVMIEGNSVLQGGRVQAQNDHRVAMSFAISGNIAKSPVFIDNSACIKTSFPNFVELANSVGMKICQLPQ